MDLDFIKRNEEVTLYYSVAILILLLTSLFPGIFRSAFVWFLFY